MRFQTTAVDSPADAPRQNAEPAAQPHATLPAGDAQLQVRMPGGATMRTTYPPTALLRDVLRDVCAKMDHAEEDAVTLRSPFPRKVRR